MEKMKTKVEIIRATNIDDLCDKRIDLTIYYENLGYDLTAFEMYNPTRYKKLYESKLYFEKIK